MVAFSCILIQFHVIPFLIPLFLVVSVLQLQLFSQIFQILDPPFDFILPGIVWIPELCFSSATNLDF